MTSDNRDYFNHIAETWAWVADLDLSLLERLIGSGVPKSIHRILDVGCGAGHLLPFLLSRLDAQGRLVALDPARRMLAVARRTYRDERIVFRCTSLEAYDGADGPFNLVLLSRVLHHLPHPAIALAQVADQLAQDGLVVILHHLDSESSAEEKISRAVEESGLVRIWSHDIDGWIGQGLVRSGS